jgi:hypothetical protein
LGGRSEGEEETFEIYLNLKGTGGYANYSGEMWLSSNKALF